MPKIGNRGKQRFCTYSFQNTFSVSAARAAVRQEQIDRYARIKNKALSGHVARRGLP
jgi:hypothetical protein